MKTRINKIAGIIIIAILSISSFTACTDDNSNNNNNIDNIVSEGAWSVSKFNEDGIDHTSYFSGYQFSFADNGTLTATNGSTTMNGTWSKGTDDSTPKLIITFSVTDGPFEEISEDWEILSSSTSKMELKHVSGGDGSIDLLNFTKN